MTEANKQEKPQQRPALGKTFAEINAQTTAVFNAPQNQNTLKALVGK